MKDKTNRQNKHNEKWRNGFNRRGKVKSLTQCQGCLFLKVGRKKEKEQKKKNVVDTCPLDTLPSQTNFFLSEIKF